MGPVVVVGNLLGAGPRPAAVVHVVVGVLLAALAGPVPPVLQQLRVVLRALLGRLVLAGRCLLVVVQPGGPKHASSLARSHCEALRRHCLQEQRVRH